MNHPSRVRPLVMRCGAFGDIVLLTALLRQLHLRFGQPVDVIASGPWSEPLLAGQSCVGEIKIIRSRKLPYWLSGSQRDLVRWVRQRGAGPTWYCDPGVGAELLTRGGVPDDYICDSRTLPWPRGEHFVDRWIRLAELTPRAFAGSLPTSTTHVARAAVLEVSAADRNALGAWLSARQLVNRPLVLMQAGNKRTMRGWSRKRATNTKYWPEERWAGVIRAVRAQLPDHAILLMGVPAEHALNDDILRIAQAPDVHNVADNLPIRTLLPLLERASSLISVDTGPAHAAAALGCPTVALFGTSDPDLYRPGGIETPAVALTGEVDGRRNILGIDVETVVNAWRALTSSQGQSRD